MLVSYNEVCKRDLRVVRNRKLQLPLLQHRQARKNSQQHKLQRPVFVTLYLPLPQHFSSFFIFRNSINLQQNQAISPSPTLQIFLFSGLFSFSVKEILSSSLFFLLLFLRLEILASDLRMEFHFFFFLDKTCPFRQ